MNLERQYESILQEVASAISGYEPHGPFSSAQDDGYYECKTREEKLSHIEAYCDNCYDDVLIESECERIYQFLTNDDDFDQSDRFYAFEALGEEEK